MTTNPTAPTATDLETDLLTHLTTTPALDDLHSTLLAALQRTGWTEKIRRLAQELLRGGRCERFDEVIEAVVASAEGRRHPSLHSPSRTNGATAAIKNEDEDDDEDDEDDGPDHANGSGNANGKKNNGSENNAAAFFENVDVRIPSAVVEQGVRAIKEVLREVVILEGDGEGTGDATAEHGDKDKEKEKEQTTNTKTSGQKDRVKGVKNGESNGAGATGSPVKKGEKKMKLKQGK